MLKIKYHATNAKVEKKEMKTNFITAMEEEGEQSKRTKAEGTSGEKQKVKMKRKLRKISYYSEHLKHDKLLA